MVCVTYINQLRVILIRAGKGLKNKLLQKNYRITLDNVECSSGEWNSCSLTKYHNCYHDSKYVFLSCYLEDQGEKAKLKFYKMSILQNVESCIINLTSGFITVAMLVLCLQYLPLMVLPLIKGDNPSSLRMVW